MVILLVADLLQARLAALGRAVVAESSHETFAKRPLLPNFGVRLKF